MQITTEDCPCRADDGTPVHDCPDCEGSGVVEVEEIEDDGWERELAEINAELDYFADDEAA